MKNISVCMIVKNEEKYIQQCIESILPIAYEIILVDTGSTDKTIEIAKKYEIVKIFNYKWDNSFSNARNYSLSKATGDFIMVLDGDESLNSQDSEKLIKLINETKSDGISIVIDNYNDEKIGENFTTHTNIRVFKKNIFKYVGIIHEQLVPINKDNKINISSSDIRINHYGYLQSNIIAKDKRNRNIPMIQKMIDEDPTNGFYLFNMGNEYMSKNDYINAIKFYEKSYINKDIKLGYCPHLYYRMAICYNVLNDPEKGLKIINEALIYYPGFTDIEYLRGTIYASLKRYTLAIDSFNKCITMGVPEQNLSFSKNIGTYLPYIEMRSNIF